MSSVPMYTTHSRPRRAATVAVATPCCPAPVSAMMRALAHAHGQQSLAEAVIDFVRAGVQQVFALDVDARPAEMFGQARSKLQRRGTAAKFFSR